MLADILDRSRSDRFKAKHLLASISLVIPETKLDTM